jgi:hypothetical protein
MKPSSPVPHSSSRLGRACTMFGAYDKKLEALILALPAGNKLLRKFSAFASLRVLFFLFTKN